MYTHAFNIILIIISHSEFNPISGTVSCAALLPGNIASLPNKRSQT